jgi:hypothetical protein
VAIPAVLLVLGVVATTWRAVDHGSSLLTWAAGVVVLLSALGLVVTSLQRGWVVSVAAVTGAVFLLAFWLKWVLADPPLVYLHPVPYDSDAALQVAAVFAACFAVAWWALTSSPWALSAVPPDARDAEDARDPGARRVWVVFVLGLVLLVVRVVIAEVWEVGVPGKVPETIAIPLLLSGLYYLSTYAPLIMAYYLLRAEGPRLRVTGYLLLLGYAAVGAVIGERSYAISAAIVLLYFYVRNDLAAHGTRSVLRRLVAPVLIVVGAAVALWVTLQFRDNGSSGSGVDALVTFVSDRVGGLNFLSPVIPVVDHTGTDVARLNDATFNSYLLVDVYGYKPDTVNGVAGTLVGLAYAVAGYLGVVLAALLTGAVSGAADRLLRFGSVRMSMWHLGALLAWLGLLLEGTVKPASILLVVSLVTGCVLGLPGRQGDARTAPHQEGRQRVHHE